MAANVEQGEDIDFRAMNGRSCGFKRACPSFRGFDITGTFFSASPELIELMTGNPVYFDFDGNPIGWDDCAVQCRGGFAIELWQNVVGEECVDDAVSQGLWFYWLLGWVTNAVLGEMTINSEGLQIPITGNTRANGAWGVGPWDVQAQDAGGIPGPMLTPFGGDCHRRGFLTTVAPPTPDCTYVEVPAEFCELSPASPASP